MLKPMTLQFKLAEVALTYINTVSLQARGEEIYHDLEYNAGNFDLEERCRWFGAHDAESQRKRAALPLYKLLETAKHIYAVYRDAYNSEAKYCDPEATHDNAGSALCSVADAMHAQISKLVK